MADALGYTLFDTAFGRCAVAWSARGLKRIRLPEADDAATVRALLRELDPAPPERKPPREIRAALKRIARFTETGKEHLADLPLDLEGLTPFTRQVYEEALLIPPGVIVTYGELAHAAGSPGASRAVGSAMGRNPLTLVIPCHRVVAAGGRAGGFSAHGGIGTKVRLLANEGVTLKDVPAATGSPRKGKGKHGLAFDLEEALDHLRAADPTMRRLIDRIGACELRAEPRRAPFQALVRSIAYQQLTGKAAATILGRVKDLFPPPFPTPEALLATSDEDLRGAGLSRSKVAAMKDLSAKALEGLVPTAREARKLDDEELIRRLVQVRGIGRWSVEMLLIFTLGRPDVLPVDDYGVRKGWAKASRKKDLPSPKALRERGARWAPYRSVAAWYLWRAADA